MRRRILFIALALLALMVAPRAGSLAQVAEVDCETLLLSASDYFISKPDLVEPFDISNAGVVVGRHGFRSRVYENYTYRWIEIPSGAHDITALAVNDAGLIGGYYESFGGDGSGWILNGTTFSTVSYPGYDRTRITAIANDGSVAGAFMVSDWPSEDWESFISTSPGTYVTVKYPGSRSTMVQSVNSSHAAVGIYQLEGWQSDGFLYTNGSYSQIHVPGSQETIPLEINDEGIVFGTYFISDRYQDGTQGMFTWSASGGYQLSDPPVSGDWPWVRVEGWNNSGQIVGTLICVPEGSPSAYEFGYIATPALRVPIQVRSGSIDVSKKNPLKIGLLSTADFSAPANAGSVVLLPWEWIWGTNDLQGGAPPLRYQIKDLNKDGLKDVLFTFPGETLYNPSMTIRGVVLKGFLPSGLMFYGLEPVDVVNNTW